MFLSTLTIENFRCFGGGERRFKLRLNPGLTALVGENDVGKSAVIDALRFVLGTTDQEWYRLDDPDFRPREGKREEEEYETIRIVCKFEGLTDGDKRAFVEYLTYGENAGDEPALYVNWTAENTKEERKGRPYRRVQTRSGENGDGPEMVREVRDLLNAVYLRPLRDAEQALSAGRGSRLAKVLSQSPRVKNGVHEYDHSALLKDQKLSVLGIGNLISTLLNEQVGVKSTRGDIDKNLEDLCLRGDPLKSDIKVSGASAADEARLRELLEKLDLGLIGEGKPGLGSNNLLFMACELLLLAQDNEGSKLLLIEEPEAHLHPQRQLQVMSFLQDQANNKGIQIIVTTHSPNLASAIELDNLVMIRNGRAFPLSEEHTNLESSDYRFLQRFLDVTKANLFFAQGVVIVEGDAENILLPTLASLLGRDFTKNGVSIVNVGGVGLRRYARIFQRKDETSDGQLDIPVACVTDMDVMPDCAPFIIGKVPEGAEWPEISATRRWRGKRDFDNTTLTTHREGKNAKASGQCVMTYVSDEWTLEYDLALGPKDENGSYPGGLAEDVFVSARLSDKDDDISAKKTTPADVEKEATAEFAALRAAKAHSNNGCAAEEVLASHVYANYTKHGFSKPVAAQYLAERLQSQHDKKTLSSEDLRKQLPKYLVDAIDYVTGAGNSTEASETEEAVTDE